MSGRWLLMVTLAASWFNVGLIWMTQVSVYPLWPELGGADFSHFHWAWWSSIWGLLAVGFVPTIGALLMLRWRPPGVGGSAVWLNVLLQLSVWVLTLLWWAPLQASLDEVRLADGSLNPAFTLLLTTHWLRVALITGYAAQLVVMARSSFWPTPPCPPRASASWPAPTPSAGHG